MIIYCSKALETALKLSKTDFATPEQLATEVNPFYAWHGHIAKVDGRNTIVLMNDKTIEWLLQGEAWIEYRTRLDLLGQTGEDPQDLYSSSGFSDRSAGTL